MSASRMMTAGKPDTHRAHLDPKRRLQTGVRVQHRGTTVAPKLSAGRGGLCNGVTGLHGRTPVIFGRGQQAGATPREEVRRRLTEKPLLLTSQRTGSLFVLGAGGRIIFKAFNLPSFSHEGEGVRTQ